MVSHAFPLFCLIHPKTWHLLGLAKWHTPSQSCVKIFKKMKGIEFLTGCSVGTWLCQWLWRWKIDLPLERKKSLKGRTRDRCSMRERLPRRIGMTGELIWGVTVKSDEREWMGTKKMNLTRHIFLKKNLIMLSHSNSKKYIFNLI